jgi:cation diffusion facilitator family transporter
MKENKLEKAIIIGVIFNIILTIIKLTFGYLGQTQALITDGYNSFTDVVMSILIFFMIRVATKKPDEDHPYGHQKFEGVAYFAIGMVFLFSAMLLIYNISDQFIYFLQNDIIASKPNILTLIVSIIALGMKLFLALFYKNLYMKSKHPTLKAESKNHALDMISTGLAIIGIILARLGFQMFDYIAALLIALLILKLAIETIKEAITFLVDQSPDQKLTQEIYDFIRSCQGVLSVDELKMRIHVTQLYVDVEIGVNAEMTLKEAHSIAEQVHIGIETKFKKVIHCMVHVNPYDA